MEVVTSVNDYGINCVYLLICWFLKDRVEVMDSAGKLWIFGGWGSGSSWLSTVARSTVTHQ